MHPFLTPALIIILNLTIALTLTNPNPKLNSSPSPSPKHCYLRNKVSPFRKDFFAGTIMTLKHHKPHICVLNDKCTEFQPITSSRHPLRGNSCCPYSTNEGGKAQKTYADKKPLHLGQTDSRNCEVYYFIGLITLKKPFRDQVTGIGLASTPVGDHGTNVKVWKWGWAIQSKERGKRSPERHFGEPCCPDQPTHRGYRVLEAWRPWPRPIMQSLYWLVFISV